MSFIDGLVIIVLILAVTMTIWLLIQRMSHDGEIIIEEDMESGKKTFRLELNTDPGEIENMRSASFKVINKQKFAD
jgi:hypothetical protein